MQYKVLNFGSMFNETNFKHTLTILKTYNLKYAYTIKYLPCKCLTATTLPSNVEL